MKKLSWYINKGLEFQARICKDLQLVFSNKGFYTYEFLQKRFRAAPDMLLDNVNENIFLAIELKWKNNLEIKYNKENNTYILIKDIIDQVQIGFYNNFKDNTRRSVFLICYNHTDSNLYLFTNTHLSLSKIFLSDITILKYSTENLDLLVNSIINYVKNEIKNE